MKLDAIKKEDIPKYLKEEKGCPVWNTYEKIRGLVGAEGNNRKVIVGEDGSFAPDPHPHLVTFWIYDHRKRELYTPETLKTSWALEEGRFPVSIVKWEKDGLKVTTTIFAKEIEPAKGLMTFVRTSLENKGQEEKELSLYVVIRHSGLTRRRDDGVKEILYDGSRVIKVNKRTALYMKKVPDAFGFSVVKEGDIWEFAKDGLIPPKVEIVDELGYASGACVYKVKLKSGMKEKYDFLVPAGFEENSSLLSLTETLNFSDSLKEVKEYWKQRVPLELNLPDEEYVNCFYTSIYYILISMTGNELWPGPYFYDFFTLHDAIEMGGALDKAGLFKTAEAATGRFIFKDDDPYLDGLGGCIFGLYEHYRITQDKSWLEKVYQRMATDAKRLKSLRAKQLTPELKNGPIYGLLPDSVSQDNFSRKTHLYVDNWWGLIGVKAALEAARVLKKEDDVVWLKEEYEGFFSCLMESFKKVMKREAIDYMPAFADYWPPEERTVDKDHRVLGEAQMAWAHRPALFPGLSLGIPIPLDLFRRSYQHYWQKSGGFSGYDGGWYVEYEEYFWGYNVMLAHAPLFLGMEEVALKNVQWSLKHQSCPGGWMEAMHTRLNKEGLREISEGVVCDIPHCWSASHYVLILRNMLLREENEKLVLLSCIPQSWFEDGKIIEVKNAPTYFGEISFCLKSYLKKGFLELEINPKNTSPEGYLLKLPFKEAIKRVTVDDREWNDFKEKEVNLPAAAKKVLIYY